MNARTLAAAAAAAAIVASSAAAAPKNVILMVADGWGYNSIQAANFWTGAAAQSFQNFPVHFAMSTFSASGHGYDPARAWVGNTYNTDYLKTGATDSASAITAMLTGVKNYDGILNISVDGQPLTTFAQMYKAAGRAAGAVSTVQWSHATPAGTYAHHRRDNYAEIALEGIASDMDVIFGAGNPDFNNNGQPASMNPRYVGGSEAWNKLKNNEYPGLTHIQTRSEFLSLIVGNPTGRYIGTIQSYTTANQSRSGYSATDLPGTVPLNGGIPSLAEMTLAALNVLDNNPNGLFLLVEGGAIDWANHSNQIARAIEETIDFNLAVDAVINWVEANSSWDDTLLIVTGDHECGMLTGPGKSLNLVNNGPGVLPGYEYHHGSHTNTLVPLFAKGSGSELFAQYATGLDPVRGPYIDNTDIFRVMSGATGVVPEPGSVVALAAGLVSFGALVSRRRS